MTEPFETVRSLQSNKTGDKLTRAIKRIFSERKQQLLPLSIDDQIDMIISMPRSDQNKHFITIYFP